MIDRSVDAVLKKQLAQYRLFREQLAESRDQPAPRPAPVITISHMTGCCIRDLSEILSARLDCQVWAPELIDLVAKDESLSREVAEILEPEAIGRVDAEVEDLVTRHRCRNDEKTVALVRVIRILAATGGVVIVGRGGAFALGEETDLRLRLVAGDRHRLDEVMRQRNADAREAGVYMRAGDSRRNAFVRLRFHADVDDPRRYDLVVNTERLEPEAVADLALEFLANRRLD